MRFGILLGVILVTVPLLLRVGTTDPWPDAQSYAAVKDAAHTPVLANLITSIPLQLLLIIAAAAFLFILSLTDKPESFIVLIAASPVFITTFTTVNLGVIGAIFIALGAVLIARRQYWAVALIPVCFTLGTSIGILASMVYIVVAIHSRLPFIALGVSFFALVSSIALALIRPTGTLGIVNPAAVWRDSVLGGHGGVTIFLVALGIIGLILRYRTEREARAALPLVLIVLAPVFEYGSIVLALALAYTGSEAWEYLWNRNWRFEELQSITLTLIICSILFATIVTVRDRAAPNDDRVALRAFVSQGIPLGTRVAADKDIAGVLEIEGLTTGQPKLPPDPNFIASTLSAEHYAYIVTRNQEPPYAHFPLIFATDSPTTYRLYAVPQR